MRTLATREFWINALEADHAGVDYIHSDAADMYDLKNMRQLMGGHQIIAGLREGILKPIECHIYTRECDRLFIEKLAAADVRCWCCPRSTSSTRFAYIINYCREFKVKIGLTLGCYAVELHRGIGQ
ncbi:MAG: hypothetical protein R2881_08175 [Eubacteriales bacterium]